jgi:hypothetical protein
LLSRYYHPLPLALIVSALLFLLACPFKTGGAGTSATPSDAAVGKRPVVHNFTGGYKAPHEKVARINPPRPHHPSGQWRVPRFLEDERPSSALNRATR